MVPWDSPATLSLPGQSSQKVKGWIGTHRDTVSLPKVAGHPLRNTLGWEMTGHLLRIYCLLASAKGPQHECQHLGLRRPELVRWLVA